MPVVQTTTIESFIIWLHYVDFIHCYLCCRAVAMNDYDVERRVVHKAPTPLSQLSEVPQSFLSIFSKIGQRHAIYEFKHNVLFV